MIQNPDSTSYNSVPNVSGYVGDSISGTHWIARVVRSMQGCSPSRIDSVIQTHLPHRTLNLSTQPDTLEIPGLKGRSPYPRVEDLPCGYRMGYFQDNSMLHPELSVTPRGVVGDPLDYRLAGDSWISMFLILCFLLYAFVVRRSYKFLKQSLHSFFFPPRTHHDNSSETTSTESTYVIVLIMLISLLGGMVFFAYSQQTYDVFLGQLSPYTLLWIYSGCFVGYFFIKNIVTRFVNWVFFSKIKRHTWNEVSSILSAVEAILLFPAILVCVYFDLSVFLSLILLLLILLSVKLLLLYKCAQIFFPKIYGILHLLSYLCALEIMPLVVLWSILTLITDSLIVKF